MGVFGFLSSVYAFDFEIKTLQTYKSASRHVCFHGSLLGNLEALQPYSGSCNIFASGQPGPSARRRTGVLSTIGARQIDSNPVIVAGAQCIQGSTLSEKQNV